MEEIINFLKECGAFHLATDDGGFPQVRPFAATTVYQDRIYLITKNTKKVFAQLKVNPNLHISAASNGKWIRVKAEAVLDNNREALRKMLIEMPGLNKLYSDNDTETFVFHLENITAVFYGMNGELKTIEL